MPPVVSVGPEDIGSVIDVAVVISFVADEEVAVGNREVCINIQFGPVPKGAENPQGAVVEVVSAFDYGTPLNVGRDAVKPRDVRGVYAVVPEVNGGYPRLRRHGPGEVKRSSLE